jgi:PIN domain nuclease of toxin-antitoxin system
LIVSYLIDTQILFWLQIPERRLPTDLVDTLASAENDVFVSVATFWEVTIKSALGKFEVSGPELMTTAAKYGFTELPVSRNHLVSLEQLPHYHGDPFDRLMLAQAHAENLVFVTADRELRRYHDQRTTACPTLLPIEVK